MSSGNIRGFSHNNEAFADILLFHIHENFHSKDGVINSFIIHEQVHTLVDLFLNRVSSNLPLVTLLFYLFHFFRKQILQDVASNSDFTSEKFKEIQRKVESSIESVKPSEEYKDFTEKYK